MGSALSYDLRIASAPITAETWADAVPAPGVSSPQPAGSQEVHRITESTMDEPLYFALKAIDDSGNESALSNTVSAVLPERVQLRGAWKNSSGSAHVDIDWQLPNGNWVDIPRYGWDLEGVESVSIPPEQIADGLHWLVLTLHGASVWTDLEYSVDILNYSYSFNDRVQGALRRAIALDIQDGDARVLFNGSGSSLYNGWIEGGNVGVTGEHPIYLVAGWWGAAENGHVNIDLELPLGGW